jgi:hypothetical protein
MRWRSALLTASSGLLLAGCGGGDHAEPAPKPPRIPAAVAARLAAEADQLATLQPGTCDARDAAERFRAHVIVSINDRQIPARYHEPLLSAANALAERLAACVEPQPAKPEHGKGHDKEKHHKKKEGKHEEQDD